MRRPIGYIHRLLLAALLLLLAGCAGGQSGNRTELGPGNVPAPGQPDPALLAELHEQLLSELHLLGKDPGRKVSAPPAGDGNAVFHLFADATAPDGLGSQGSSEFMFYPRMVGDYDGNGEVGISDITPLGLYFGQAVVYDDPADHGGIKYWPSGDPDGEGRQNWIKARVDGDGNGEINTADITPIAIHFGEHSDGWRVEQRFSADGDFAFLPHPEDGEAGFSVGWSELAPDSIGYHIDGGWPDGGYLELRVQAWENASGSGGPMSSSAIFEYSQVSCTAFLQADPVVADFPFDASFTAAGSSVVADSYVIDFGDGSDVTLTSLADFPVLHSYTAAGIYDVLFTVNCGEDNATDSFQIIATPLPCEVDAQLAVTPDNGFAPLNVLFSAVGTTEDAQSYTLDFGDGSAPLETTDFAELSVQHEYLDPGSFTATLTAFCENGSSAESTVSITVNDTGGECAVNLSVDDNTPILGTESQFFFSGTTGTAALLDFGDGSDVKFVNLQGPEPILYTYAETGTFEAVLSIICNDETHTDTVLMFVQPEPVQSFDAAGGVYQYESNPPIGGPEPDKFPLEGAEVEIYNVTDDFAVGTTTTDAEGQYFFDGEALGLDVNKIYMVQPTEAEKASRLPLDWFPGQAFIAAPTPGEVKQCSDINLLATPTS